MNPDWWGVRLSVDLQDILNGVMTQHDIMYARTMESIGFCARL